MNFSERYKKLEHLTLEDRILLREAERVVSFLDRPEKLQIDTIHEGEYRSWDQFESRNLLEHPEVLGINGVSFLSSAAFYYLLPLLLVIGLLDPNPDYRDRVVEFHMAHNGEGAPDDSFYRAVVAKLLDKWLLDRSAENETAEEIEMLLQIRALYEAAGTPHSEALLSDYQAFHHWASR